MTPDNRALWELVESGDMAKLLSLARRTLHFAYVWNDHNFGTPKGLAKDAAIDAGLFTLDEANNFIEKIEAILERPVVVGGWLPIESALKDGQDVLLAFWWNGQFCPHVGRWDDDKYARKPKPYWKGERNWWPIRVYREFPPTHWMPLPAAPETNESMVRGKS